MRVNQGTSTLYLLLGLKMVHVAEIMRGLIKENGTTVMDLTINDCSSLCFVVWKSVHALVSFLMKWANVGFHDIPKCNGMQHPILKQALNKRRAAWGKKCT
jgi:hypothetical protein